MNSAVRRVTCTLLIQTLIDNACGLATEGEGDLKQG